MPLRTGPSSSRFTIASLRSSLRMHEPARVRVSRHAGVVQQFRLRPRIAEAATLPCPDRSKRLPWRPSTKDRVAIERGEKVIHRRERRVPNKALRDPWNVLGRRRYQWLVNAGATKRCTRNRRLCHAENDPDDHRGTPATLQQCFCARSDRISVHAALQASRDEGGRTEAVQ